MSTAFDRFDFAGNEAWRAIERNLYFSSSNKAENDAILLKRKRKWFKANIDPDFEWTEDTSSGFNQTYGNKQSSPQPKVEEPDEPTTTYARNSSNDYPSNANANTASSPRQPKSKYFIYLSWIQLALHALILLNCLTYVLPLAGIDQQSPSFSRVMIINFIAQLIYLYRQHGRPQWNAEYGRKMFMDEQSHYTFLSIVLMNATPSLIFLLPFFSRSLVFVCGGLKQVLPARSPRLYGLISKGVEAVVTRYGEIYSTNALLEVLAGFVLILNLFTPARNLFLLFGYFQYLRIRYMLSTDSKRAWNVVRVKFDGWIGHPMCPTIVRTGYTKIVGLMEQYTDTEAMARQAEQPGLMNKCTIM